MDRYLTQLGMTGPLLSLALYILIIAEIIKVGKVIWDFVAPKVLGIQTAVSKEKRYRKQTEDNNVKLNEYLDTQNEINKDTTQALNSIISKLEVLSDDVIDLKIEEMRQKILDFASALNDGRIYTREQYNFVRKLYDSYEKFIVRTGKTNDEVEISMEIINSCYTYCVKHHCFVEDRMNDTRVQMMFQKLNDEDDLDSMTLPPITATKHKSNRNSKRQAKSSKINQSVKSSKEEEKGAE